MPLWLIAIFAFLVGAAVAAGLYVVIARLPELLLRRRVEGRIRDVGRPADDPTVTGAPSLVKSRVEGPLPVVDRLVGQTQQGSALGRWIEQSGLKISVSGALLLSLASGVTMAVVASAVVVHPSSAVAGAAVGLVIPACVLAQRRSARLRRFEERFPEALDLLSRAVRAGHAFTTGLKMVADEVDDPVGPEFRKTFDEQNFGLPLKDALNNLAERVSILDVRFFATAVLIQRETGGNLAEVLDNLAHVVRERFKILRQVRVYTAHGRLTGYVLLALPAALAVALFFINPDHMNLLFRERMGQSMLLGAIVMQVVGFLWIRRVVKIEV